MYTSDKGEYHSPWAGEPGPNSRAEPAREKGPRFLPPTVLVISVLVVVGIALGLLYSFARLGASSGATVSIEFTKPDRVLLGQPFSLPISISNTSDKVLKDAHISLLLPDGVSFLGNSEQRIIDQAIGDLGPGSISQQFNSGDAKFIVTDGAQSVKHFEAKLVYDTGNSKNQYESTSDADVLVGDPAVSLAFVTPQSIFNGQDFDITVNYENKSSQDVKNLRLKLDYPPMYHYEKASIAPETDAGNSWNLGILPAGANGTFTITGQVVGPENSFFTMSGALSADFSGETYAINQQSAQLAISSSPLSISVALQNGAGADYLPHPGESLTYLLHYKNNSSVVFTNVNIRAALSGSMFNYGTLTTQGVFNSLTNTVNWFAANTPVLQNIPPGAEGAVTFSVNVKNAYPIRLISDKNFTLKVDAQIDSPTIPPGTTAGRTVSVGSLENKIPGQITVAAKGFWRDAQSGILNAGPYPPQVNQTTQYTVHWIVTNYATDVTNAVVTANLPEGAQCTGKIQSNSTSQPVCNPDSGLVTWQIGNIPATRGIVDKPLEAIFQIQETPAVNQAGTSVTLVGPTTVQAQDSFTGTSLSATADKITTDLPDDTTITTQDRKVRP